MMKDTTEHQCTSQDCEHLVTLNKINMHILATRNENTDLKKQIHFLKAVQVNSSYPKGNNNYYEQWKEKNKENMLLTNKLVNSKKMVADLQVKMTDFMQAIRNLEASLELEKAEQGDARQISSDTSHPTQETYVDMSMMSTDDPDNQVEEEPDDSSAAEAAPHANMPSNDSTSSEIQFLHSVSNQSYVEPEILLQEGNSHQAESAETLEKYFHFQAGSKKPYKCSMCHKAFAFPSILKGHIRTHTGERPFHCDICGKSFAQSTNLANHVRTHTGEKPYECNVCHKKFASSHHLEPHYRIHTGEKPFQCKTCGKRFVQSSHLAKHELTHKSGKSHTCKLCHRSFRLALSLAAHPCVFGSNMNMEPCTPSSMMMEERENSSPVEPENEVVVLDDESEPKDNSSRTTDIGGPETSTDNIVMIEEDPQTEYYDISNLSHMRSRKSGKTKERRFTKSPQNLPPNQYITPEVQSLPQNKDFSSVKDIKMNISEGPVPQYGNCSSSPDLVDRESLRSESHRTESLRVESLPVHFDRVSDLSHTGSKTQNQAELFQPQEQLISSERPHTQVMSDSHVYYGSGIMKAEDHDSPIHGTYAVESMAPLIWPENSSSSVGRTRESFSRKCKLLSSQNITDESQLLMESAEILQSQRQNRTRWKSGRGFQQD